MTQSGINFNVEFDGAFQATSQSGLIANGYLRPRLSNVASISSRATPASQGLTTAGTNTGGNTKASHISPLPLVEVRFAYGNYYNNSGVETDGVNDITVRASIEYPAATFIPLYFSGKRDVLINAGGTVWSDWVSVSIPALTAFWSRTYVTVTANTMRWPLAGPYSAALLEGATAAASPTDQTTSGTLTGGGYGYGPFGLQAMFLPVGSLRIYGIGDSRITGNGDTDTLNGWFGRAFDGVALAHRVAWPSETAQSFATNAGSVRRKYTLDGANIALCNYGVNDLSAGRTLLQLQTDNLSIWTYFANRGMRTFQTTIEPSTTSSDNWATLANQTVLSWNPTRVAYNNWLRDGAPLVSTTNFTPAVTGTVGAYRATPTNTHPLSGYIELADVVESARDSGKWAVTGSAFGYTTDGLHQSPTAHALQAKAINIATLTSAAIGLG